MTTAPSDQLHYAGFCPRLGALLLDILIMLPLSALAFWASERYRLFDLYYLVPSTLLGLFYGVYLVQRFGGTAGKLIVGIRICMVSGEAVGYREAVLRYLADFVLGIAVSIAMVISVLHMSDAEYRALSFMDRVKRMVELAPSWYHPLLIIQNIWVWGELIVLLTNRKRRALHDFIAGTVVVRTDASVATAHVETPPNLGSADAPPASAS